MCILASSEIYDAIVGRRPEFVPGDFEQWLAERFRPATLSDGRLRDENANNFVAYFSDFERRFAAYASIGTDSPVEQSVLGAGAISFVVLATQT